MRLQCGSQSGLSSRTCAQKGELSSTGAGLSCTDTFKSMFDTGMCTASHHHFVFLTDFYRTSATPHSRVWRVHSGSPGPSQACGMCHRC